MFGRSPTRAFENVKAVLSGLMTRLILPRSQPRSKPHLAFLLEIAEHLFKANGSATCHQIRADDAPASVSFRKIPLLTRGFVFIGGSAPQGN